METIRKSDNHAVGYSLLSYLCGYYRTYYPEEYIAAYLATAANDEDIATGKQMAKRYGVHIVRPKFRQDNRTYYINKQAHEISDSIASVKDVGLKDAEALYSLSDGFYLNFTDLLYDMFFYPGALNQTVVRVLIMSDYFSEFGQSGKLMQVYTEFYTGKNKITKSLKPASVEKRTEWLRNLEENLPDEPLSMQDAVAFDVAYYGTPLRTYPEVKGLYAVMAVDEKFSPKVMLYNLASGTSRQVKIRKPYYKQNKVTPGNIIRPLTWKEEIAYQYVGGKSKPKPGVFDLWITTYDIL